MMNQLKTELSAFASTNQQQQRGKSGSVPPENDSLSLERQTSEATTVSSVASVVTTPGESLNQSKLLVS